MIIYLITITRNIRNNGVAIGNLARDPVIFDNKDGSRKVCATVAVANNYTGSDGQRTKQFINLEDFIRSDKENNGVYDYMHTGDRVGFEYSVRQKPPYEKNGQIVYGQVLFIEGVDLMDSKATAAARPRKKHLPIRIRTKRLPQKKELGKRLRLKGKKAGKMLEAVKTLEEFADDLREEVAKRIPTFKVMILTISGILKKAIEWNVIMSNPCDCIKTSKRAKDPDDIKYFTIEQTLTFPKALDMEYNSR